MNNLIIKPSKLASVGVFTTVDIPVDSPVIEKIGKRYALHDLPDDPAVLQISNNIYIGPSGAIDDQINHSCNPNCRLHIIGFRAILYSMHLIKAGTEITFDYSTSSTETLDQWQMQCNCKSFNCRKIISGFNNIDEKTKEEISNKNMLPQFMKNKIFSKI